MSIRNPQVAEGQLGFDTEGMQPVSQELPPSLAGTKDGDYTTTMRDLLVRNPMVSFGRVVMPYYFDLDPQDYTDITPRMVKLIRADEIEPFLYSKSSNAQVEGLVLPSHEYSRLVRFPRAFNAAVDTKEFSKTALDRDLGRRTTGAQDKARETLAVRVAEMQSMRQGIEQERGMVSAVSKEARTPGYAHLTFLDLHTKVSAIREIYFGQILEVVGREKGWTADQHKVAQRALDVLLFMTGNERVGNFRNWLQVELNYVTNRAALYDNRIAITSRLLQTAQGSHQQVG